MVTEVIKVVRSSYLEIVQGWLEVTVIILSTCDTQIELIIHKSGAYEACSLCTVYRLSTLCEVMSCSC